MIFIYHQSDEIILRRRNMYVILYDIQKYEVLYCKMKKDITLDPLSIDKNKLHVPLYILDIAKQDICRS